ncbi:unnamed protein product [Heligmosomoides polygyrus]|uniref:Uncharacterized protein n=1 Tax=Heligmosomoides polygyrus TaxID=6339 RepID=A0A3P7Z328_HELPZ|nr:unnamed protein product [Heligmosomoides polygyrus]
MINPYIYMPICVLYVVMILTSFIISAIIYFIAHTSTRSETRQRTRIYRMHLLKFFGRCQDSRDDTEVSTRTQTVKWNNTIESTPLTTAL